MSNREIASYLIPYLGGIVFWLAGFVGFLGGFVPSYELGSVRAEEKRHPILPTGHLKGIVVTRSGRICLGIPGFDRIYVYDRSGSFLGCIRFDAGTHDFRMMLDNNGNIHVAALSGSTLYIFDEDGKLLHKEKNEERFSTLEKYDQFNFEDSERHRYRLMGGLLPGVVKSTPDGREIPVISTPLFSLWFLAPVPSLGILAVGALTMLVRTSLLTRDWQWSRM